MTKSENAGQQRGRYVTRTSRLCDTNENRIPRGRIVIATSTRATKLVDEGKLRPATEQDVKVEHDAFRAPVRLGD